MMAAVDPRPSQKAAAAFLYALAELDAAELGALRRAARKPLGADVQTYDLFRDLFHRVRREYPVAKWVCYLVARLYASHPTHGGKGNLGDVLRTLRPAPQPKEPRERFDKRFLRLLDARDQRALATELAAWVRILTDADRPVPWASLFDDLAHWYRPGQPVQTAWAQSYFNA